MADALRNFSYSTVATAPSPATSGTSLVVAAGDGAKFAVGNAVVWPPNVQPSTTNAEIVRVTAISTDTLTITRAQEGTSAQSIAVGWQIQQGTTAALLAQYAALSGATFTGAVAGTDFGASGLTGATAASRYVGATTSGAPVSGTFAVGDFVIDQTGKVWVCTAAGTPGTWGQVGSTVSPATTVTGPDAFGAAAVVGTSALYAREDHDHGLPADPTVAFASAVAILTNKRITKRVLAFATNAATYSVDTDNYDVVHITAQTATITSIATTGTPVDGDTLRISITGTAAVPFTLAAANFEASTVALSTTTTGTARLDMGFFWNSETSKWRQVAAG